MFALRSEFSGLQNVPQYVQNDMMVLTRIDRFFFPRGSASMILTADEAKEVIQIATERSLIVVKIEGGVNSERGFEARVDCIWDGFDPPISGDVLIINNKNAIVFIEEEEELHSGFVLTFASKAGYS